MCCKTLLNENHPIEPHVRAGKTRTPLCVYLGPWRSAAPATAPSGQVHRSASAGAAVTVVVAAPVDAVPGGALEARYRIPCVLRGDQGRRVLAHKVRIGIYITN